MSQRRRVLALMRFYNAPATRDARMYTFIRFVALGANPAQLAGHLQESSAQLRERFARAVADLPAALAAP